MVGSGVKKGFNWPPFPPVHANLLHGTDAMRHCGVL